MSTIPDKLVQQFLDGDLRADEEADALRHIAEDAEARALLRFDGRLRRVLRKDRAFWAGVPDGFTDRVMQAVAAAEDATSATPRPGFFRRLWKALVRPRPVTWRPAYVLLLLALLIGVAVLFTSTEKPETEQETVVAVAAPEEEQPVLVRFMFVDEDAHSVAVAGDFNYWEPMPLTRQVTNGRVLWSTLKAVPPGEHRYMFVVDGEEWVTDPFAPEVREDGFGQANAILSL